jgi:hypothetical protein
MSSEIRIVKKTVFIMTITDKGPIFEMANSIGTQNINGQELPKFDYDNKVIFKFSDYEAAKIVRMIDKQFLSGGFPAEIKLTHYNAKEPKKINLIFSLFKDNIQCGFSIYVKDNQNKNVQIYLDENELEILKENLKLQYTLSFKDDMNFKQYIANKN